MLAVVATLARLGAVGSAGLLIQDQAFQGVTFESPWHGIIIALLVVSVVVSLITWEPIRGLVGKRPVMRAGELDYVRYGLTTNDVARNVDIVSVPFRNEQDGGGERATAQDVVAKIEAFEPGTKKLVAPPAHGRWGAKLGRDDWRSDYGPANFRPTHEERLLNVVARGMGDDLCYLINDPEIDGGFRLGSELPVGEYRLEISLRGDRLARTPRFSYLLTNEPNSFRVEPLPKPSSRLRLRPRHTRSRPSASLPEEVVVSDEAANAPAPDVELQVRNFARDLELRRETIRDRGHWIKTDRQIVEAVIREASDFLSEHGERADARKFLAATRDASHTDAWLSDLITSLDGIADRLAGVAPRKPTEHHPPQRHPPRKPLHPSHHAIAALDQQRDFGQDLRDWLAGDTSSEPQFRQEYTALIRMRQPTGPADTVEMWVNETAAVLQQHAEAETERFLSDDGLPPGTSPISILDRRLYRLEEILDDLRSAWASRE